MTEQEEKKEATKEDVQSKQEKTAAAIEAERESRVRGQRALIIHVLLMFLVSIVVFVIGSYFFIVPRVVRHRLDAQHTAGKLAAMQKEVASLRDVLAQGRAPAVKDAAAVQEKPAAGEEKAKEDAETKESAKEDAAADTGAKKASSG